MSESSIVPVRGPRWTHKRLVDMLTDCYGPSSRGALDVAGVAAHLGVSTSTVRRWLRSSNGPPSRVRPGAPRERITQLQRASDFAEEDSERRYRFALRAIEQVGRGDITPAWRAHGWLDEHIVAIFKVHGKPWHQIVFTKGNRRAMNGLRLRGTVVGAVMVPNRFHAIVVAHLVMLRQQKWRVCPAESQLDSGRTQVWMSDAPPINLEELAAAAVLAAGGCRSPRGLIGGGAACGMEVGRP